MGHQAPLQCRHVIEQVQADIPDHAQRFQVRAEQAFESVGGQLHQQHLFLALAGIARQHPLVADGAPLFAVTHDGQQVDDVAKPQVHAMAGQRMHGMRRVAHQRHVRRHHRMRLDQRQRQGSHGVGLQRAQRTQYVVGVRAKPDRQLAQRLFHQRGGQGFRRRPHERDAVARQRQQRDDAVRAGEPLVRDAVVRLVAGEVGDDGALVIHAVVDADIALPAHPRFAPVRADQQRALDTAPVFEPHGGAAVAAGELAGAPLHALHIVREPERGIERAVQVLVFDDPCERADPGAEGIEAQVAAISAVAVHVHRIDRGNARHVEGVPYLQ